MSNSFSVVKNIPGGSTGEAFSSLKSFNSSKAVIAEYAAGNIQFLEFQVKLDLLPLGAAGGATPGAWASVECGRLPLNCFVKSVVWSDLDGGLTRDDGESLAALVQTGGMLSNVSSSDYVPGQVGPKVFTASDIHSYNYQFNRIMTPFTQTIAKEVPFCNREFPGDAPRYVNMSFRTKPGVAATNISGTFKALVTILQGDTQNSVSDDYPTGGIPAGPLI